MVHLTHQNKMNPFDRFIKYECMTYEIDSIVKIVLSFGVTIHTLPFGKIRPIKK